jgi:NH3-dependent NAD+ synthetase
MKPPAAAKKLGVSLQQVQKVQSMIEKSAHKRSTPPIARL